MSAPHRLLNGLVLGESPRWHDDRLWLADWGAGEIVAADTSGAREVILNVASFPFDFEFLPDGRILVVNTNEGVLVRREHDGARVVVADLRAHADIAWHRIVVDAHGNAYVSGPDRIAVVTPCGAVRTVATGLAGANGLAVSRDEATLVVAEAACRLTAFDIAADGTLYGRRMWAQLDHAPAGICLDADGAAWVTHGRQCSRVLEGGRIVATITLDRDAFACTLGGRDEATLFVTTAQWQGRDRVDLMGRTGQVVTVPVAAPRCAVRLNRARLQVLRPASSANSSIARSQSSSVVRHGADTTCSMPASA